MMVADAADTVVTISANGVTYEHRAYALGMGAGDAPETDKARAVPGCIRRTRRATSTRPPVPTRSDPRSRSCRRRT